MDSEPKRAKQRIDAKRALEDIRSGASDSTLMERYRLSRRGLQSLFKKLEASGLLRLFNPAVVIQDIRRGATREDLMRKYSLSTSGIRDLYDQLSSLEIGFRPDEFPEKPHSRRICSSDLVHDMERGMDRQILMSKYDLTGKQFSKILDKLESSETTARGHLGALSQDEEDTTTVWQPREYLRCYPILSLAVADAENPVLKGAVVDLSEKGVGLVGISAVVDDSKALEILPTIIGESACLRFTARCRWTGPCSPQTKLRAGFEITCIDESNLEGLRELIMTTTACL
jgi:uncharacterized protein (DUF433 family)